MAYAMPPREFVGGLTKAPPIRDKELRKQFLQDHAWCFACGIGAQDAQRQRWPGLAVHHLLGASARSDEECNFLVLCQRDHDLRHGAIIKASGETLPTITLGMTLTMKLLRDPDNYDPQRLTQLWKRSLPEPESLPDFLVSEWTWRQGCRK